MWPIRKHGEQYHAANWVNASAPSLTLRLITDFTQPSVSDIRPSDSPATEVVTTSAEPPLILQRAKERNGDITEAQRACRNRKKNFEELKRIYRCDRPSSANHSSQQREKLKLPRVPLSARLPHTNSPSRALTGSSGKHAHARAVHALRLSEHPLRSRTRGLVEAKEKHRDVP